MGDLHRVSGLAVAVGAWAHLARHASNFFDQLYRWLVALAENGVAAVGRSSASHASAGIKAGIQKGDLSFRDEEL